MLGLPDHILVAAAGESTECLPSSDATNKFGASFETPAGRKLVGGCNPFFNFQEYIFWYVHVNSFS